MQKQTQFISFVMIFVMAGVAAAQTTLFQDDFNSPPLNVTTKWRRGNNSDSVIIQGNSLRLKSPSGQIGWIVTQQAFPGNNTSATLKIVQPSIDGDIGISPTLPPLNSQVGIYNQLNFYRFYIHQDNSENPPLYKLFACKRKNGGAEICDQEGAQLTLDTDYGTPLYLRMRLSEGMIFFEYSYNGCLWYIMYFEPFDLPGFTTSNSFYYEIASNNTPVNGIFKVDDFKIENYGAGSYEATDTILNDPLNSTNFDSSANPGIKRRVIGGSFPGGKWKPNSSPPNNANMIYYDLGRYIENGSLEIDVTKFYPQEQNNQDENKKRHHVLAMFRQPWVGHHVVENIDMYWDLHTGKQFGGGVKFLSNTYYSCDEFTTPIIGNTTRLWPKWVKSTTPYRLKVVWDNLSLKYYRNDTLHTWHVLKIPMQLRYLCVGRDSTVSGDLVTGFLHNQYPTMSGTDGPLYSNLIVKEFRSSETTLPTINNIALVNQYQNAARLSWTTNEATVCYMEYGQTTAYGKKTKVLGPPATSFTTLLANLSANTSYHYRITAEDEAGNIKQSTDQTFSTATNGTYVFKPVADTYIEDNHFTQPWLYGPTRAYGNYGWMNLMTAENRDAFLQFNVTGNGWNRYPGNVAASWPDNQRQHRRKSENLYSPSRP